LGNEIQRVRVVFKYGYDARLLKEPMRYGPTFKRPSRKVLRKERAKRGPRMFTPEAIQQLLKAAPTHLRAMILLGCNCGFGNADVGTLPQSAVDLKSGWVKYPRPKTGIDRRCPLWPETIAALKKAIAERPKAADKANAGLVFMTKYGQPWSKETNDNPVSQEFRKLLDETKLHRPGLGFYTLRHVFETIGGASLDQPAVDHIMGHARDDMASAYREHIEDARLRRVTDHVHAWLFPPKKVKKVAK
jgi:integrase